MLYVHKGLCGLVVRGHSEYRRFGNEFNLGHVS
jgi:hypothetical protein